VRAPIPSWGTLPMETGIFLIFTGPGLFHLPQSFFWVPIGLVVLYPVGGINPMCFLLLLGDSPLGVVPY